MVLSFTSLGGKIDRSVRKGKGPNMLVLQAENRTKALSKGRQSKAYKKSDGLKKEIIGLLIKMLNETNPYVKQFRSAKDRFTINPKDSFHMRIDGFRLGIKKGVTKATEKLKKENISMRQFFAFRLHERKNEAHTILNSGRLFQQFVVDAYTTIESNRLRYLRTHQTTLRSDSYDSIKQSENAGRIDMAEQGSSFLLPATFTGGPRYMKNLYLDAMTICKHFGFPDLFITFTCNPKWPEITRHLTNRKSKAEDRSDIICRMFKMKLDSLMDDLTKKNILGKTVSSMYTIEFQKRGLPHAHILLFMHPTAKRLVFQKEKWTKSKGMNSKSSLIAGIFSIFLHTTEFKNQKKNDIKN
ncbi:BnaC03g60880D [Brassica napus]|uniref:BnaC03g60880D protein n=1 Tax=Brassica napus TaxID=3708 RepID=A0A078HRU2_BRANA|nr:BnaC03g60880D [Brassica napus]